MTDQPTVFSIAGFFKLTRVWNLLIIVFTQVFTSLFLFGKTWMELGTDLGFLLLIVTTTAIAAGGYVINDYYDVKIDFINKPDRVVVGKTLKRRAVMAFHIFLSGFGLLAAILISWKVFIINFFSIGLLWLYSNQLKRMPFIGNLSIAILTGLSILVLSVYFDDYGRGAFIYAFFAFFFTLIREIVKDMQDLKGDEVFGCRTLPIVWGIWRTKQFIFLLMLAFSVGVLFIIDEDFGEYWLMFLIGLFLAQLFLLLRIYRADTVRQMGQISQICKIVMIIGILSMPFFPN